MIHRALLGSFERFIGIMLEHYGGELPLWLAPVQAIVLPVSDRFNDYAARGVERAARATACASSSTIATSRSGARSARPSCARSPTCSIVGEREQSEGAVSVREHHGGDAGSVDARKLLRSACRESYTPRP